MTTVANATTGYDDVLPAKKQNSNSNKRMKQTDWPTVVSLEIAGGGRGDGQMQISSESVIVARIDEIVTS